MARTPRVATWPADQAPVPAHVAAGDHERGGQRQGGQEPGDHQEFHHVGHEGHPRFYAANPGNPAVPSLMEPAAPGGRRGGPPAGPAWQPGIPRSASISRAWSSARVPIGVYFRVRSHVTRTARRLIIAGWLLGGVGPDPIRWPAARRLRRRRGPVGFALGVVSSTLLGGNAYVLKVRDGFFTALFGVICIVTIYTHERPALFYVSRYLSAGKDPYKAAPTTSCTRCRCPPTFRVLSVMWGVGLVAEAAARMALAEELPTGTYIAISPVITAGVIGGLFAFTLIFFRGAVEGRRRWRRRGRRRRRSRPHPAEIRRPQRAAARLGAARSSVGPPAPAKGAPWQTKCCAKRRGNVEIITINRPDARNAINGGVSPAMSAVMDELTHDPDCWVVVITGAAAGVQRRHGPQGVQQRGGGRHHRGERGVRRLTNASSPSRSSPRSTAPPWPAGSRSLFSCDLVVAAEQATAFVGIPEANRGLIPGAGGLIRMPKRLPMAIALEMAMTGDPIDATRAYTLGLVNQVVPGRRTDDRDPGARRAHRRRQAAAGRALLQEGDEAERPRCLPSPTGGRSTPKRSVLVFSSADAMEGPLAFAEKRPPKWQGK